MIKPVNNTLYLEGQRIETNSQLVALYQKRIGELGIVGKTMFYLDEVQHQTKVSQFAILLHNLVKPNDTVLDIGCGYGSLSPLLPSCHYLGIDLVPEFISYASQKYPFLEYRVLDLEEYGGSYDWGVLLGVTNSIANPDKLVQLAWSKCRQGIVVDFIDRNKLGSSYVELNRFDMGVCLNGLLELGTQNIEIYPTSNVWTIFIAKRNGLWLRTRC